MKPLIDHRLQIKFVFNNQQAPKQTEVELFSEDFKQVADVPLVYFKPLTFTEIEERRYERDIH